MVKNKHERNSQGDKIYTLTHESSPTETPKSGLNQVYLFLPWKLKEEQKWKIGIKWNITECVWID